MIRKAGPLMLFLLAGNLLFSNENNQPVEITLKALSGLQYDQVRFQVAPGSTVKLTLINADEMVHNIVFTQPDAREEIVELALQLSDQGNTQGYVPSSDKIIAAIPLLAPDEKRTITFRVPDTEGIYPYVCTYPGHGTIMYGAMYVSNQHLPPLSKDEHIPPNRRAEEKAGLAGNRYHHPYPDTYPMVYRTFMPDCGPAGIAVGMLGDISYCWDAGQCRLRYAWKGDFLDLTHNWSGKGKEMAVLLGLVFYRDNTSFPFRIGNPDYIPQPDFKGYTLTDRYPTFSYDLDDVVVTERIIPTFEKPGFKRTFTFKNLPSPLWFESPLQDKVAVYCNKGRWEGPLLKLTPEEAREFTIVITEKSEGL